MYHRKRIFTVIVFLLISAGLSEYVISAPSKTLNFEYLRPNEGLSQASVMQITQDRDGFMWFGTRNGLNRYDGYEFIRFYSNPEDTGSIPGDLIHRLYIDADNALWIGTDNGFCVYDPQRGSFRNFSQKAGYPPELVRENISYIYQDSHRIFWLGTFGTGLVRFDPKTESYRIYSHHNEGDGSISSNSVKGILEDESGKIWVATDGGGLNLFDPVNETFRVFRPEENNPNSISNLSIYGMVEDKEGTIWLGTLGDGICRLNKQGSDQYSFDRFRPETEDVRRLKILSLFADPSGGIWIGTENGGLDYFDTGTKVFYHYELNNQQLNSLNSNSIQSIYKDAIGNLWVGTYTGGVNVNKVNKKAFHTYRKIPGNSKSLSYNAVTCFYEKDPNEIWIGTDGGGLNRYDRNTGIFKHYNSNNSNLPSDAVLAICRDSYNTIWVAGWGCGLNRYDPVRDNFIPYTPEKYDFPHNNIFDLQPDREGNLWISFGGDGLIRFNTRTHAIKQYTTTNSDLPNAWIFDLNIDPTGNMLLGHSIGFSLLDPATDTFLNYFHSESDSNSLSQRLVNMITVADDSTLWIGTSSGMNHFDPETESFRQFFRSDGLPNNNITGIAEDEKHRLWISTNDGISRYNPESKEFRNYSFSDGLQGNGFIRNSYLKLESGEILFGGTDGFTIFHPDSLKENPVVPRVVLTNFYLFNKPVTIGAKDSPLPCHINSCKELRLSYDQSVISFEFAGLEFTAPEQNQYAYKLIPFDKEWNEVGNLRTATYTNLDPGEYTLLIKASNNDGVWTPEDQYKRISIIIEPPYWKTAWFRLLVLVLIISAAMAIFRLRIVRLKNMNVMLEDKVRQRTQELNNRTLELEESAVLLEEKQEEINSQKEELLSQRDALEERNKLLEDTQNKIIEQNKELDAHRNKLETLVEKRTRELSQALKKAEESDQLKSSFLANMSHEIRTPMNAITGFASLLMEKDLEEKEKEEFINIINRNSEALLVLINDIIDISTIQARQMQLYPTEIDLENLLDNTYKNFTNIPEQKSIEFILQKENIVKDLFFTGDAIRITQVLNNLITNAVKFTRKGTIEIGVLPVNEEITFYVKDTGIGIPEQAQGSIFERFKKIAETEEVLYRGTGLGLAISKSLVELWGGKIWYRSEVDKGTTFYFSHPLKLAQSKSAAENVTESAKLPTLAGKTILVAEDEEDNFRLLSAYLVDTGARVIWVKSGREAVQAVQDHAIDLVLMDIKMPGMNGKEATRRIRKRHEGLPVVAQTAYTYRNEIREMKDAGINDYLSKPIKKIELAGILRKYL